LWSCDAEHRDTESEVFLRPLATVRDVSLSVNSFRGHLNDALFRRTYGIDLALCDSYLREHKYYYLLTYLLTVLQKVSDMAEIEFVGHAD